MTTGTSQKTLQQLEWGDVLARLAQLCDTAGGRSLFDPDADATDMADPADRLAAVRERLAETGEARRLLAAAGRAQLAGIREIGASLRRAGKGGVLGPLELQEVGQTLYALESTRLQLAGRDDVPRLSAHAERIAENRELADAIAHSIDAAGDVADAASVELAEARRESRRLAREIQARAEQFLRDPDTTARLTDSYYTVRNDRFVLPVRADARSSIRGIVHDASSSGNTIFIEPEALVELNNRRKRAEIAIEREIRQILSQLTRRVAHEATGIESGLEASARLDAAFARGRYADELDAVEPEVGRDGVLDLPGLRHPLIASDEVVANDIVLGRDYTTLVISGPNAGGKTVAMKAAALAVLFTAAGLHVPARAGARVDLFDEVLADIGDEQDIRGHLSTFSAHMANLAEIVERANAHSLVILDEVGVGTDPGEGAAIAQASLETLADAGARTITTTHYNLLKELAEADARFANASVAFDPDTLEPTYRLQTGLPGSSSATAVAARMGLRQDVIERANRILEREDHQLDRILVELNASRAALEREQLETQRIRKETEAVRDEHEARLARLRDRRDALYRTMRGDLDRIFGEAHERVAGVIRELQRGGRAQDAAVARDRLLELQAEAESRHEVSGIRAPAAEAPDAVDWRHARVGDAVSVAGSGHGTLLALPDKRGRVAVRVASVRLLVGRDRVSAAPADAAAVSARQQRARVGVERAAVEFPEASTRTEPADRCDLRGLKVDEAEDRLLAALDRAAGAARPELTVVHGVGTGALRAAVERFLGESPYVADHRAAEPSEGGEGVTIAVLR